MNKIVQLCIFARVRRKSCALMERTGEGEAVAFDCSALERFLGLTTPEDIATLLNVYSGGSRVYGNSC